MAKKPVAKDGEVEVRVRGGTAKVRFDTVVAVTINGVGSYYRPGEYEVDETYLACLENCNQPFVRL